MQKDMTQGGITRCVWEFALPLMGSHMLQTMYNIADAVIVANVLGPLALGAIGLTSPVLWLLVAAPVSLGTGVSIVIAQYYGAKDEAAVREGAAAAYSLALFFGLLIPLACLALAKPLITRFLLAPSGMAGMSLAYFRIYSLGVLPQMFYNVAYGILRAHGDSRSGLFFLVVSTALNIALDVLFVIYWGLGTAGAAWATFISQLCCALCSIAYLAACLPRLSPRISFSAAAMGEARLLAKITAPIFLQSGTMAVGFSIMQRFINYFGAASIQGFVAMNKIEMFVHIPSNSFNSTISAFAGQNIGAGRPERALDGYRSVLRTAMAVALLISAAVTVFSKPLLGVFNISGEAMRRGWEHLMLIMLFLPFSVAGSVTAGFLQGAGDVKAPALSSLANLSARLAATCVMMRTFVDYRSVYVSLPVAWIIGCAINVLRYRSGRWRSFAVVKNKV